MVIKINQIQTNEGFPEKWEIKQLSECGKILMGQSPPGSSYNVEENGYPLLNGAADLKENGIFVTQFTSKPTRLSKEGDLLFCIRATIGNLQISDTEYCLGRGVAAFTVDQELDAKFVAYQLQDLFELMRNQSEGGVIKGLRKDDLGEFKINIPKEKQEQEKIGKVLSDTDKLIDKLENLITKKKNIKKGIMQELLTGKRRLEGFSGNWNRDKLGDIFVITAGGDLQKEKFSAYTDGAHPYPIYSNSLTNEGLYGYSTDYQHDENCVTVTARGSIGVAFYRNHKFSAIGRLLILKLNKNGNSFLMSEIINYRINFSIESTGVPQLTAPQISKYLIVYPEDVKEQDAIAEILSNMDSEIEELEKKKEKYLMLKKGMMQKLLTGEIRLQ